MRARGTVAVVSRLDWLSRMFHRPPLVARDAMALGMLAMQRGMAHPGALAVSASPGNPLPTSAGAGGGSRANLASQSLTKSQPTHPPLAQDSLGLLRFWRSEMANSRASLGQAARSF